MKNCMIFLFFFFILFLTSLPQTSLPCTTFRLDRGDQPLVGKNYDWGVEVFHKSTSIFPDDTGVKDKEINGISVSVASPERAIMECLHLAPRKIDLVECFHLFEGLVNLKPKLVTELLSKCTSVKVKRLFLFMRWKDF